jgi:hypothetical protein
MSRVPIQGNTAQLRLKGHSSMSTAHPDGLRLRQSR